MKNILATALHFIAIQLPSNQIRFSHFYSSLRTCLKNFSAIQLERKSLERRSPDRESISRERASKERSSDREKAGDMGPPISVDSHRLVWIGAFFKILLYTRHVKFQLNIVIKHVSDPVII